METVSRESHSFTKNLVMSARLTDYGRKSYWDERYVREGHGSFDWLQTWGTIKEKVAQYFTPVSEVLHIGCGNSRLAEDLHNDGIINVTNIDNSEVVISAMREKYEKLKDVEFVCMDAVDLQFPSTCFDVVIDKGTIDSILCGEGSAANVSMILREVYRVLSPGGAFIMISHGQPSTRLNYLQSSSLSWNVTHTPIAKPVSDTTADSESPVHYIYFCVKPFDSPSAIK